jgi:probable HAF family extracellular repeat protein
MSLRLFTCCSLLITLAGQVAAEPRSLGMVPPKGEGTVAYDINASGQVAAVIQDDSGRQRAVLFENGKLLEIPALGGKESNARGINDKGQVVGAASRDDGHWRAYLYDKQSGLHELGTLGGPSSHGVAINQHGDVAGFADTPKAQWHAFLFERNGAMRDLGTLGGALSFAAGMNNSKQVVGSASLANEVRHAFVYDAARGMVDLGTLGGQQSGAVAINDHGVIVGASETKNGRWHAFIHDGKRMIDLGEQIGQGDSYATDINNSGHVVGTVQLGEERMSFVWRDNKVTLHRGGHGLRLVNAINDRDLVIGATGQALFTAATMPSNAAPVVATDGKELFYWIMLSLVLAVAAVLILRRYRGISMVKNSRLAQVGDQAIGRVFDKVEHLVKTARAAIIRVRHDI